MTVNIIEIDTLRRITGYDRAADVERSLSGQGIKTFRGRHGRLWTTVELINQAGGLRPAGVIEAGYTPDVI